MPSVRASRQGFTLIEIMVAVFLLAGVILLMAPSASRYLSTAAKNRQKLQAAAVADAQIALIRVSPAYDSLTVRFNGTTSDVPFTGWTRTTTVVRSGAGTTSDITRAMVTVTGPGLATPVKRYATITAP
jgi:prepilin-type N-terminal cleavage/methylation domain-containing protein